MIQQICDSNIFVARKVFDDAFIDEFITQHDDGFLEQSQVYGKRGEGAHASSLRTSEQRDIKKDHTYTERIAKIVKRINVKFLHINVSEYCRENHFLKYTTGGHFSKHKDLIHLPVLNHIADPVRKISAICLLSDCNDFEGGKFVVYEDDDRVSFEFNKGDVIIFPSYTMHQVDPITAGVRYSTVHWSYGGF